MNDNGYHFQTRSGPLAPIGNYEGHTGCMQYFFRRPFAPCTRLDVVDSGYPLGTCERCANNSQKSENLTSPCYLPLSTVITPLKHPPRTVPFKSEIVCFCAPRRSAQLCFQIFMLKQPIFDSSKRCFQDNTDGLLLNCTTLVEGGLIIGMQLVNSEFFYMCIEPLDALPWPSMSSGVISHSALPQDL